MIINYVNLINILKKFDSLLIAFSGGVDSTFLLAAAQQALQDKVTAITALSPIQPKREKKYAIYLTKKLGVQHIIFKSKEMSDSKFISNTSQRCYFCKQQLFADMTQIAKGLNIRHIAHGATIDDLKDFRPGYRAAQENNIYAPLIDAKIDKNTLRILSKEIGLSTWNNPSQACLASRIPYGTPITTEKLSKIEKAENFLIDLGFKACRVRYHDNIARIEIEPENILKIAEPKIRYQIITRFKKIGFIYTTIDLEGYVHGSMNKEIIIE